MSEGSSLIALVKSMEPSKKSNRAGATFLITKNLEAINGLREQGHTWDEIAAGLAALGATQKERGSGVCRPISGKRCAALFCAVEKREARRALRRAKRARRPDLVGALPVRGLAVIAPREKNSSDYVSTEADIRREAFERVQALLRKPK
jgi:hypothetical protein